MESNGNMDAYKRFFKILENEEWESEESDNEMELELEFGPIDPIKPNAVNYNAAFNENKIARVFKEASDFRKKFHNMDSLLSNGGINPFDFIDLYTLFVIDVSHQSERLKESTVDIQIRAEFARNVPSNTEAFALVISDRILQFESDGQKMNVVY
ncbi:unnamed protein product [Mytilus edulis]|uniref:Double jelly roll-like domain-containing protein n=1 Tax=Mytilus edulis TaxID=6550 RepID=A0A8S3PNZ2_MYTED|nr:unnamed protein product [Mytilus edulis]